MWEFMFSISFSVSIYLCVHVQKVSVSNLDHIMCICVQEVYISSRETEGG